SSSETLSASDAEIATAQKIIEKMPNEPTGYSKLAVAYIRRARETGDFSLNSNAQTAIDRALEIEPQNYDAQKLKASLLLTFHRFAEALEAGKKLQAINPRDAFVYGVMTDANIELGNYKEAVETVQKMVDTKPNMESYARVAHVRSLHGDSDGAIEAMGLASRVANPMDKEAQSWCLTYLGNELLKVGRFAEAEKEYDGALKIFPDYHLALAGKAHVRASAGDYENAIRLFTQTQTRVPTTETVIALGDVYTKTGNAEKAAEQYKLAEFIEQKLENQDQRRLALLWADQDTKLDEALAIAEREYAARKDIYTADIYAWCLYKKGDFQKAKTVINEALRLKTKDALFFYHAGMIEKSLGGNKAAKDFLQKALETNPNFDLLQAEKAKAALQELN
ncbi:MAG TPA: tetratricopeptide repeat protein, partial [Pyrinomonadaceae bacterium]|nr:tetratricopeptide repeat protein [Pyrinomonadaceae bacterium]